MIVGDYCVGIDLGTSGVKVAAVARNGEIVALATRTYPLRSLAPGWAETDPFSWWTATCEAVREVVDGVATGTAIAVSIDGQMHGTVLIDGEGLPVRNAILWPDSRASDLVDLWRTTITSEQHADLANPLTAGMPGPVLAWLAEHEPDTLALATSMMFPKDWVRSRFVPGSFDTDASDASASLLWSVTTNHWRRDIVASMGVNPELLPTVRASTDVAGLVSTTASIETGLPAGIPVAIGSGDVAATLLGLDRKAGTITLIIGTGAQALVSGVRPQPSKQPTFHTFRSWDSGWYAMAAVTNAGLVLQHVTQLLAASWPELYAAADRDLAIDEVQFLPYLTTERFSPGATAGSSSWWKIGLSTTREDMLYAALEAVSFSIADAIGSLPDVTSDVISVVGGGSNHRGFLQLIADVTNRPIRVIESPHATAVGAAYLAAIAAARPGHHASALDGDLIEPRTRPSLSVRYRAFHERGEMTSKDPS